MDKYTRIYLKLNKLCDMKKAFSEDPNEAYKRYADHRIAYAKLRKTIEGNGDFILNSIVKGHEYDAVKTVSQMKVANYCFSNELFLHLLATCSIANRLRYACDKNYMSPELIERIRDCMVVFCE